jgi:hypothetical protein
MLQREHKEIKHIKYGMDIWGNGIQFPARARDVCPLHSIQTGSRAHPDSYVMGTGG